MTIPRPVLGVLLALPVAAVAADPSLVAAAGLDLWNLPAAKRAADEQEAVGRQLDAADALVLRRLAIKEAVAGDLIAGRTTLADATDAYATLSRTPVDRGETVRAVIEAVRLRLNGRPEHDRVLAALEAEAAGRSPAE